MKASYLIIAVTLMVFAVSAQVKYTALIPMEKVADSIVLDLNLDGIPDFILKHVQKQGIILNSQELKFIDDCISIVPCNRNEIIGRPLEYGSTVNNHQNWSSAPADLAWTSYTLAKERRLKIHRQGAWVKAGSEYLGLKLNVSGQSYYGWIRLEVANDGTNAAIYDFAFSNEAGSGIFCTDNFSSAGSVPMIQIQEGSDEGTTSIK